MLTATCWAHYDAADVSVIAGRGVPAAYAWRDKSLRFVRCKQCGCVSHWEPVDRDAISRMGVNARNFAPSDRGEVRVRLLDGAKT